MVRQMKRGERERCLTWESDCCATSHCCGEVKMMMMMKNISKGGNIERHTHTHKGIGIANVCVDSSSRIINLTYTGAIFTRKCSVIFLAWVCVCVYVDACECVCEWCTLKGRSNATRHLQSKYIITGNAEREDGCHREGGRRREHICQC